MTDNHPSRKFGFMASLDFRSWTVKDVVMCLSRLGYTAVEWTMAHFQPFDSPKNQMDLARLPEQYGMQASELVVQQDLVTLDASLYRQRIDLIAASIQAAAQIGVPMLNLYTGPAHWNADAPKLGQDIQEGAAWKLVLGAFEQLVPLAERYKVYLAIEAVFGMLCRDYYTLNELLAHFDSPYLAVNMDPSHFRLYGNDIPWIIQRLGPRIEHVHLKDVVGRPGLPGQEFAFPLLGDGVIDWPGFMAALDSVGYQGALSVEFEAFSYYEHVLQKRPELAAGLSMQQIKSLFPVPSS